MPRVQKSKVKPSEASLLMLEHLRELPLTWHKPVREWQFNPDRKWRFDFALIPAYRQGAVKIGIEIEGGVWIRGRHTRGSGFLNDMEKYNHAALLGWRVLRFTPQQVLKGEAIEFIKRVLEAR